MKPIMKSVRMVIWDDFVNVCKKCVIVMNEMRERSVIGL
jgi:hypothetical protein